MTVSAVSDRAAFSRASMRASSCDCIDSATLAASSSATFALSSPVVSLKRNIDADFLPDLILNFWTLPSSLPYSTCRQPIASHSFSAIGKLAPSHSSLWWSKQTIGACLPRRHGELNKEKKNNEKKWRGWGACEGGEGKEKASRIYVFLGDAGRILPIADTDTAGGLAWMYLSSRYY